MRRSGGSRLLRSAHPLFRAFEDFADGNANLFLQETDMKRSIHPPLAAAMLIAFAMTASASAAPPSNAGDVHNATPDVTLSEEQHDSQATEEEPQTEAASGDQDAPSGDISDAETAEEDSAEQDDREEDDAPSAQESKPSESRQLKHQLKQTLLGLLLPVVERRIRKAAGSDSDAESAPEPESEP
jgi:hypothetical protein